MKKYFVVIIFILSTQTFAAPAGQALIDQYVNVAFNADLEKLKGAGPISCKYSFSGNPTGADESDLVAQGKDISEISQRLALLCIKQGCQNVGRWIMLGFKQVDQVSDSDNSEFLQTQGYTATEIDTILKNRRTMDRSGISNLTCQNSTPTARMVIFDSCFSVPMACSK